MFIYDLVENNKKKSKGLSLKKVESRCLFLDEIIDIKFMNDTHILLASNNEYIKLVCLADNSIEIYRGHTNILLSIDVIQMPGTEANDRSKFLCLSAAKDNEIRMWFGDLEAPFQQKLQCLSTFQGHTESIQNVCFAPRKVKFFVSCSADNTIKVWNVNHEHKEQSKITSA